MPSDKVFNARFGGPAFDGVPCAPHNQILRALIDGELRVKISMGSLSPSLIAQLITRYLLG